MKKSELYEFIKSEITATNENFNQVKAQFADLVQVVENIYHVGEEENNYFNVQDAAADAMEHIGDVFGIDFEFGSMNEQGMTTVDDEDVATGKVDLNKLKKSGVDVKITEDDDETDKQAAKQAKKGGAKGRKLDIAIKDLRRIEKNMKSELEIYKTSEGEEAKNAAKKRLKDLTDEKKEAQALIKRLEGNVIK